LRVRDFISIYKEDPLVQSIGELIRTNENQTYHLKGLVGSLDAVLAAALYQINKQTNLFVMHDKEEAAYFHNDLQNLIGEKEVLLFPTSFKKRYSPYSNLKYQGQFDRVFVVCHSRHKQEVMA